MCTEPSTITLPDGRGQQVACRNCDLCRRNETKDWTGRCLAEARMNPKAFSVTLTYAPLDGETGAVYDKAKHQRKNKVDKHVRAAVLTYSDIQKYFKRLRKRGYALRYIIAGECGSLKGRTHWHGIFYFKDKVPPHKLYEMFNDDLWPHGHQVWKKPEPSHVAYCTKYNRKDVKKGHEQSKFEMSKNPPIGGMYFVEKAVRMAQAGIPLNDLYYTFPEAKKKDGTPVKFYLKGATADLYRQSYATAWRLLRGQSEHWPVLMEPGDMVPTDVMMEYLDRVARKEAEIDEAMSADEVQALLDELAIWRERANDPNNPKRQWYADGLDEYYLRQRPGWANFTWEGDEDGIGQDQAPTARRAKRAA